MRGAGLRELERFLEKNDGKKAYEKLLERRTRPRIGRTDAPASLHAAYSVAAPWRTHGSGCCRRLPDRGQRPFRVIPSDEQDADSDRWDRQDGLR